MTGERLQARLDGASGRPAPDAVRLLAQRVYLLERALDGLDAGRAADAFVQVAAQDEGGEGAAFAGELVVMYECWAGARGMRVERLAAEPGSTTLAVSGLAAYTILQPEAGLHVLEVPTRPRAYDRVIARVAVAPRPFAGNGKEGATADAAEALAALREQSRIVRRYRREPSPLVRDAVRGWRTGRIDRVLAGDFDVVT
jgi:ATP-dependent Clp protease ATP-binding subunit ClpC